MFENYKIVSDLFYTEVCLDLENKYPIVSKIDIPMYVFIEYKKDLELWDCTCRLEPLYGKNVTIVRQYSSEMIGALKELEEKC